MSKKTIQTDHAPKAIGPYSQAVAANGLVFTSGQIAIDPATQELKAGTIEEQTHLVCRNLKAVLEAAGSGLDQVVKTTIFLDSMDDFAPVNEIYAQYFTTKPARSTVAVDTLPKHVLVEIDCVALV